MRVAQSDASQCECTGVCLLLESSGGTVSPRGACAEQGMLLPFHPRDTSSKQQADTVGRLDLHTLTLGTLSRNN